MLRLVVAVDAKNGIAKGGAQPWHIPEDLLYVKELTKTKGGNVLMGYKTLQVIGHALEGRHNYVLSRHHMDNNLKDVFFISDLTKFLKQFKQDLWIFGGAQVFAQTISLADEIYLTMIDHDYDCDQFFPSYEDKFKLAEKGQTRQYQGVNFRFNIYKRI